MWVVHTSGAIKSATPKMFVWCLTLLFLKLWFLKGKRKETPRRRPIVLGTFTSSSRKFVDLSYRTQTGEAALAEKMFYGACLNWNKGVDKS